MSKLTSYSYLEIGTYLGGSLTPFLRDPNCTSILSIDDRDKQIPDERGMKIDYSNISEKQTIDNLILHKFDITKIKFFDGSISEYKDIDVKYKLVFIDGEHTDLACFRDFIYSKKIICKNSIIAFHDSSIIYKSLMIINELLESQNIKFKFINLLKSSISLILLNDFSDIKAEEHFQIEKDLNSFYQFCEKQTLLAALKNRTKINLSFDINEMPLKSKF